MKSNTNPWTAEEDATMRRMLAEGATFAQIGKAIGRGRGATKSRAKRERLNTKVHAHQEWTDAEIAELRRLIEGGASRREASKAIGRGFEACKWMSRRLGYVGTKGRKPTKTVDAWTDEQDAQLKRLIAEGLTYRKIAPIIGRTHKATESRAKRIGAATRPRSVKVYDCPKERNRASAARRRAEAIASGKIPAPVSRDWSAEDMAALHKLVNEGMAYQQIADTIGKTKGAVAGMASREGLRSKHVRTYSERQKSDAPKPVKLSAPKITKRAALRLIVGGREVTSAPLPSYAYADEPLPLICEGLPERETCKWPHGDEVPFLFCGQPAERGPYCPHHTARAFAGLPVAKPAAFKIGRALWR